MLNKKGQIKKLVSLPHKKTKNGINTNPTERELLSQLIAYSHESDSVCTFSTQALELIHNYPPLKETFMSFWKRSANSMSQLVPPSLPFELEEELRSSATTKAHHQSRDMMQQSFKTHSIAGINNRIDICLGNEGDTQFYFSLWSGLAKNKLALVIPFLTDFFGVFSLCLLNLLNKKNKEEYTKNLMDVASDAIFIHNLDGLFIETNKAACKSLGYTIEELQKLHVWDVELGPSKEALRDIWNALQEDKLVTVEGKHRRKDGTIFPVDVHLNLFNTAKERLVIAIVRDISQRKSYEEMLKYQASYDTLTNLPNRFYGYTRLEHAVANAYLNKTKLAVLFLDLNGFKQINDTLGHAAGDALLKTLSERFLSIIRQSDTIARIGGDEFMMILEHVSQDTDAELIAKKCHDICLQPFTIESQEILISSSIGIALFPEHGADAKTLMHHADLAMYHSKINHHTPWTIYSSVMDEKSANQVRIKTELHKALVQEELYLCYQPIMDIKNNVLIAAEALLRWHSSTLGDVLPDQFIPIAEESGFIIELGYWILRKVCIQIKEWELLSNKDIKVAVNISTMQLKQKDFIKHVEIILKETGIAPEALIFDITESAFIDDTKFILSQLNKLDEMNIHCSLDDFGMKYSSLHALGVYPFKSLKIDRAFIQGIDKHSNDLNLVNSIITMSKTLELKIVAKGIETEEQLRILRSLGCDMVQGWYFSEALNIDHFLSYLNRVS